MNTDPIADLLTRLRNASAARHDETTIPASRLKRELLRVLEEKGRISGFQEVQDAAGKPQLKVRLIAGSSLSLRRVSSPGQRIYIKAKDIYPTLRGYGLSIVSTSEGLMTGDDARAKGIGGEVLCEVL
jgi:small subunit ribosomal protein S8